MFLYIYICVSWVTYDRLYYASCIAFWLALLNWTSYVWPYAQWPNVWVPSAYKCVHLFLKKCFIKSCLKRSNVLKDYINLIWSFSDKQRNSDVLIVSKYRKTRTRYKEKFDMKQYWVINLCSTNLFLKIVPVSP